MPNDTSCSPTGTCVILSGTVTNGTDFVAQYNPNVHVNNWRQHMELATICICNSLSFIIIICRIWYRWSKLKRFRGDDKWMGFAALILLPFTASQIGTNAYGSGLHFPNVPKHWRALHWHFMLGWVGYYIIVTSIKLSVCICFLQILTVHHKRLRYAVYTLCGLISGLGLTMVFSWLFDCQPVSSNFLWSVLSDSCINYDIFRYLWIAGSIPIDLAIMSVPLQFLRRLKLRTHERRILKMVFTATLLGTITCTIGIYGAFETRTSQGNDAFYQETAFVMMCDIEILMYTLGASFPILSRYMVQKADPGNVHTHENFSSWARYVPNFFSSNAQATHLRTSPFSITHSNGGHGDDHTDESVLKSQVIEEVSVCNTPDLQAKSYGSGSESEHGGFEEGRDLERADVNKTDVRGQAGGDAQK